MLVCASTGGERELSFLVWLLGYLSPGPISEAETLVASICKNYFGSLQCDFVNWSLRGKKKKGKKREVFAQPLSYILSNTIKGRGAVTLVDFLVKQY